MSQGDCRILCHVEADGIRNLLLFTRVVAVLLALVAVGGIGLFAWTWATGERSVFLTGGSYGIGAAILLGLNVVALACHELGHALAAKHAGRKVPAAF